MTFPDHETGKNWVEIDYVTPAEAFDGHRWHRGRIHEWIEDAAGWHAFFWPDQDDRKHTPRGWLDLDQVRPSDHVVDDIRGHRPSLRDVPSWWWPADE